MKWWARGDEQPIFNYLSKLIAIYLVKSIEFQSSNPHHILFFHLAIEKNYFRNRFSFFFCLWLENFPPVSRRRNLSSICMGGRREGVVGKPLWCHDDDSLFILNVKKPQQFLCILYKHLYFPYLSLSFHLNKNVNDVIFSLSHSSFTCSCKCVRKVIVTK